MRFSNIAGLLFSLSFLLLMCSVASAEEQPIPTPEKTDAATVEAADTESVPPADKKKSTDAGEVKNEKPQGEGEEAGQGAFAAPAAEPESESQEAADEEAGSEVVPVQTDFGAEDEGAPNEKTAKEAEDVKSEPETENSTAVEKQPDSSVAVPAEETKPEEAKEVKKEEKDFPKSPYPEMDGLSDRNFKLSTDEDKDKEDGEARKKIRRHTGFYLRLAPSLAYMNCKGKGQSTAEKLNNPSSQGVAGLLDVFVGGAVVEDWILHADLSIAAPFAKVKGVANRKQINTIGIGLGFTHYFMPQNLYLSSNVSYAQTKMMKSSDGQVQSFDTANGFKINAAFGKEWWVADQFGLGVAGTVFYSWCRKSVLTWNIYGAGAVFTLTYN